VTGGTVSAVGGNLAGVGGAVPKIGGAARGIGGKDRQTGGTAPAAGVIASKNREQRWNFGGTAAEFAGTGKIFAGGKNRFPDPPDPDVFDDLAFVGV